MKLRTTVAGVVAGCAVAGMSTPVAAQAVSFQRLLDADAEPQNWLMVNGNYSNWRHSGLTQINKDNVGQMVPLFAVDICGWSCTPNGFTPDRLRAQGSHPKEETIPLAADGFIYTEDGLSKVSKIDVRSGRRGTFVWRFDPEITSYRNRKGLALLNDNVYVASGDVRVIALNMDTGEPVFDTNVWAPVQPGAEQYMDELQAQALTAPPLAVTGASGRNIVMVGESGTLRYGNHWLAAVDADTGEFMWRWWSVPSPGEPGHETWKNEAWVTGGGGLWSAPAFDPETNVYIGGTGDTFPSYDPEYRPGDNLFTVSTVAINVDTGELEWYFQATPNERWDLDTTNNRHIWTALDGTRVVSNFERQGFWYNHDLDASMTTADNRAAFIRAVQYTDEVTWTAGIDPKTGFPMEYDPNKDVQTYLQFPNGGTPRQNMGMENAAVYCPHWGGQNVAMEPSTLDPDRRKAFTTVNDSCRLGNVVTDFRDGNNAGEFVGEGGCCWTGQTIQKGYSIISMGLDDQKRKKLYKAPDVTDQESGLLGTAGGLLFTGWLDGDVEAFDKDTGALLWSFSTGSMISAAVMTYAVDGKQYVAVQVGGQRGEISDVPDPGRALGGTPYLWVFGLPN